MEYFINKEKVFLPEYGRSIQQMVNHAVTIENRTERELCVRTIIHSMGNLFPHLRDTNDFKHKLWDHLAIMSNFKLDIDSPYESPSLENLASKPEKLHYTNRTHVKHLHYGRMIEVMIDKALAMEEGEERDQFLLVVANQMKKNFMLWNKENVDDAKVFKDLYTMSKGKINLSPELFKLTTPKDLLTKRPQKNNTNNNGKGQQQKRNNNNGKKK